MKIIRSSCWMPDDREFPSVTIVVRQCDINTPIDEVGDEWFGQAMVTHDIFDIENDPTMEDATFAATLRVPLTVAVEAQQAILYWWTVGYYPHMKTGGTIASKDPAPLNVPEVKWVLEQLGARADYRAFKFEVPTQDGKVVTFSDGHFTVQDA